MCDLTEIKSVAKRFITSFLNFEIEKCLFFLHSDESYWKSPNWDQNIKTQIFAYKQIVIFDRIEVLSSVAEGNIVFLEIKVNVTQLSTSPIYQYIYSSKPVKIEIMQKFVFHDNKLIGAKAMDNVFSVMILEGFAILSKNRQNEINEYVAMLKTMNLIKE